MENKWRSRFSNWKKKNPWNTLEAVWACALEREEPPASENNNSRRSFDRSSVSVWDAKRTLNSKYIQTQSEFIFHPRKQTHLHYSSTLKRAALHPEWLECCSLRAHRRLWGWCTDCLCIADKGALHLDTANNKLPRGKKKLKAKRKRLDLQLLNCGSSYLQLKDWTVLPRNIFVF